MELTGRTYVFAGATLLLLAGSLKFYADNQDGAPSMLATFGAGVTDCQSTSVRTANVRLGCQSDIVGGLGGGSLVDRGGSKTIRVGG